MTTEERQLGRAKNAVLNLFEQKLVVPKIYLDANWDGTHLDVLAIDREGVGDVHAALLFARPYFDNGELNIVEQAQTIDALIDRLSSIAAQYKYIGAVDVNPNRQPALFGVSPVLMDKSLSPDGIGRIGFLTVTVPHDNEPHAKTEFKPERFRAAVAKLADAYVQEHSADWEIRV